MKSLLKYVSSLTQSKNIGRPSGKRKSRKSSSIRGTSYQTLERRDLLATFTVTTLQDSVADDGLVSLREAITAANTNAAFGDATAGSDTGDTIGFAPQLQGQTIELDGSEIEIFSSEADGLQIIGNVTLDAQNQSKIFYVEGSGDVLLAGLDFVNGQASSAGGAIEVYGAGVTPINLQISQAEFRNNNARFGGAIDSFFTNLQIGRSTFTGNSAELGGAIGSEEGNLKLFQTTFTDQTAIRRGGAILVGNSGVSITESTFNNNTAGGSGGAVYAEILLNDFFIEHLSDIINTDVFITQTTFNGNVSGGGGGAVLFDGFNESELNRVRAVISDSEFIGNAAEDGGGLYSVAGGQSDDVVNTSTFVINTLFEGNVARGGDSFFAPGEGGGIYSAGELFVLDSTILSNSALSSGGGIAASEGGNAVIVDSLISENRAERLGGGISVEETSISVINSTVSFNRVNNPIVPAGTLSTSQPLVGGGLFATAENQLFDDAPVDNLLVFISGSDFISNFAGHAGGAVATEGTDLRVVDSEFSENRVFTVLAPVLESGETFSGGGGAISHRALDGVGSSLVVARSNFEENVASFGGGALGVGTTLPLLGGGISTIDSDAFLIENRFDANFSEGSGGGLAQTGVSTLRSVNNDFFGNRAGSNRLSTGAEFPNGLGGAIFSDNASTAAFPVRINGGTFQANSAINSGGAIFAASLAPTDLLIRANGAGEGTVFNNNRALRQDGGAIAGIGIGLNARDALFANNSARNGGAAFVEGGGEVRLAFNDFRRNAASDSGGAINFFDTDFIDFQNVFLNNTATQGPDFFEEPAV